MTHFPTSSIYYALFLCRFGFNWDSVRHIEIDRYILYELAVHKWINKKNNIAFLIMLC